MCSSYRRGRGSISLDTRREITLLSQVLENTDKETTTLKQIRREGRGGSYRIRAAGASFVGEEREG
jgi:hypothetical protein